MFLKHTHYSGYVRSFLAYCNVYAINSFTLFVKLLLIDNGIDYNCCFACLAVADNQFTLSPANRNHGINRLNTSLKRLVYRLTENNTGSFSFERHFKRFSGNRPFTVDGICKGIHHPANKSFTCTDRSNTPGAFYRVTFFYILGLAQQYHPNIIFFKVQYQSVQTAFKLNKFA